MDCDVENSVEEPNQNKESVENFQKFIYELLEKNGVLNDLRAYLRGHIVEVINNAKTGDPPACQKHFTQRLELTYQALNMLVAEYLLCLDFSYSLSVFITEIPLANMVFSFARTFLQNKDNETLKPRFSDSDVWSILNYLGVKCDSEHAYNVVQSYKSGQNPLLLCILKGLPLYQKETISDEQGAKSVNSSASTSSAPDSTDTMADKTKHKKESFHEKCKHYIVCKTCQARMSRIKDKYKKKKKDLCKNVNENVIDSVNGEQLMKTISVLEKSLIDEMFQQLKMVYEAELDLVKKEEDKKIKRYIATHTLQLQRQQTELEEAFKLREAELQRKVQEKKKFLWGLARALREQHTHMSRAMSAVKEETERLTVKEDDLKSQLIEAQSVLRQRGEEMRTQISSELSILEEHLHSMKREREIIQKERIDFENRKHEYDSKSRIDDNETKAHYELLQSEFNILKKYIESTKLEPKCVIERSTVTELCGVTSKISVLLNNEQDTDRILQRSESEDRNRAPNQVVNNLKKQKNVNFSQSHVDIMYQERVRSRSSMSSDAGDAEREARRPRELQEENERLKTFAKQQQQHITELTRQQARMQAELTASALRDEALRRPRTAPSTVPQYDLVTQRFGISASYNSFGWRKGAGEELSAFSNANPRILVPGDMIPFVGVLRDRHNDNRRQMINHWRTHRRFGSPTGVVKRTVTPSRGSDTRVCDTEKPVSAESATVLLPTCVETERDRDRKREPQIINRNIQSTILPVNGNKLRDKSPKSLLREAKENLRPNKTKKSGHREVNREKSPNSVLKEAKLRLRKLEIEAEAVEQSYLNFKKRQTERQGNFTIEGKVSRDICGIGIKRSKSLQKLSDTYQSNYIIDRPHTLLTQIQANESKDEKKATSPILKKHEQIKTINNYLETPLTEFRKLYHSQKTSVPFRKIDYSKRKAQKSEIANENAVHKDETDNNELTNNFEIYLDNNDKPNQEAPTLDIDSIDLIEEKPPSEYSIEIQEYNEFNPNIVQCEVQQELETYESQDTLVEKHDLDNKQAELEILKDNITKIYNLDNKTEIKVINLEPKIQEIDNNLTIEVENVTETNSLKLKESELELVVESSVDDVISNGEEIPTRMTILVGPKVLSPKVQSPKSLTPHNLEQMALQDLEFNGTLYHNKALKPGESTVNSPNDVLDAIFHAEKNSNTEIQLEEELKDLTEGDSISESERDEYVDDFSADVDNYNSRSDYENNSPISLPKTSEDENFWDN